METLKILGVCYIMQDNDTQRGIPEKILKLSESFKWFLSAECMGIRHSVS
jgi:hypothetical protein